MLLRKGSAGSNTTTDHLTVLTEAIAQLPVRYRRDLLITVDGAGASHGLVDHITTLGASPWRTVHYSIGWELGARERTAITHLPAGAWGMVLDTEGNPRDPSEAGVAELTALLRQGPGGDQLAGWPKDMRIIARREKPHPGAQLSLFEAADGWRYQLLATNTPTNNARFLEARHGDSTAVWRSAFVIVPGGIAPEHDAPARSPGQGSPVSLEGWQPLLRTTRTSARPTVAFLDPA